MPKPVPMPSAFPKAATDYASSKASLNDLKKEFGVSLLTIKKWMLSIGVAEKPKGAVISAKKIGKTSPRKGAKHSEETLALMRENAKTRMPTTQGFKFTDESKAKMRKAAQHRMATTDSGQKMRAGRTKNKLPDNELMARAKARNACKRMLQRILTMARIKKDGRRSELLLGYTKQDLRAHIEAQFKFGMGWGKRGSFHIDHIKPVAQFFREGVYDPVIINALSNLQVLTPAENWKKSDTFIDKSGTRPFA
jgi:hypothetical protein